VTSTNVYFHPAFLAVRPSFEIKIILPEDYVKSFLSLVLSKSKPAYPTSSFNLELIVYQLFNTVDGRT
jgi:hypothetical protein